MVSPARKTIEFFERAQKRIEPTRPELAPQPAVAPTPAPVPAPTPSPVFTPQSAIVSAKYESVFRYMPEVASITRDYMDTGEFNRDRVLWLDRTLDTLSSRLNLSREDIGRTMLMGLQEALYPGVYTGTHPMLLPADDRSIGGATGRLAEELGVEYSVPDPSLMARAASWYWENSLWKLAWDDPTGRATIQAFSAAATPALAAGGGFWAGMAAIATAELAGFEEREFLLATSPFIMPKKLGGAVAADVARTLAKGEKPGVVLTEKFLAETGFAVTAKDVGRPVLLGGKEGVLSAFKQNVAKVTLTEGRTVTVSGNALLKPPSGGFAMDMAGEANAIRQGKIAMDGTPLTVTPSGLMDEPMGVMRLHGTSSGAEENIIRLGTFRTSEPAPGVFRAVYTTGDAKAARSHASVAAKLRGEEARTLTVETPVNARIMSSEDVLALKKELSLPDTARGWDNLSKAVRAKGYDGVDLAGIGAHGAGDIAWVNPQAVRPVAGAPAASSLDDFFTVADSVMKGEGRVFVLNPMAGGAAGPYSAGLETLVRFISNNDFDRRQLLLSMSRSAKSVTMPGGTVGKIWAAARRPFNPSVGKLTRESFFASFAHREVEQTSFAAKMLFLQKAVKETLGRRYLKNIAGTPFTELYVGKMPTDPARKAVVGSFTHMVENVEKYNVPSEWHRMAKLWQNALDEDFKLMQSMGFPGELLTSAYVPHVRARPNPTFLDRFFRERGIGGMGVGRPGITRPRKYPGIEDWAEFLGKTGELPELDPFKLYAARLMSTMNLRTTQVYIQGILRSVDRTGKITGEAGKLIGQPIGKGKTPRPGWLEILPGATPKGGAWLPGVRTGRWQVPEAVAQEARHIMSKGGQDPVAGAMEEVIDVFRGTLLSVDLSFYSIQGYGLAAADPVLFLSQFANKSRLAMTEEGFLMELVNNIDAYALFMRSGGTMYISAADIVKGFATPHLVERLPVIGWMNNYGYGRFLPMVKRMQFESMSQMLLNIQQDKTMLQWFTKHLPPGVNRTLRRLAGVEGKPASELFEAAADTVGNIGGGVNWGKIMTRPSLAGKLIILTEGWVRANMGRIINAAKFGDPKGVLARRWLFQNLALTATISEALSMKLSGRHIELDPRQGDWLDIQVPGGSIPILPGKTYVRTIMRTIAGKPWDPSAEGRVKEILRFGEGRYAQFIRAGLDVKSGTDFFGRTIDNKALYVLQSLLPLAAQSLTEMFYGPDGVGPVEVGVQFGGLNFIPVHPFEVRDTFISGLGLVDPLDGQPVTTYFDMNEQQRKDFDDEWPEYTEAMREWQHIRPRPISQLNEARAATTSKVTLLGRAFLGETLTLEEQGSLGPAGAQYGKIRGNQVLYARMLSGIQTEYYLSTKGLLEPRDDEPSSMTNEVVRGYYEQVVEPSIIAGEIDHDVFSEREELYRAKITDRFGDEGIAVFENELALHSTDDPVAAAYHKDKREWAAYYRRRQDLWNPANIDKFGISGAAKRHKSFMSYRTAARIATEEQLVGKPLDLTIGSYRTTEGGDTIFQRFGIRPGKALTQQQANEVAEELVRLETRKYQKAETYEMENWLLENQSVLCNMAYWGEREPTLRLRAALALCPTKTFAP